MMISAVILGLILSLQIGYLTRNFLLTKSQLHHEIMTAKTYHLARSGLIIAPSVIDQIPSITFPASPEIFYKNVDTGLHINDLGGTLSLFKSANQLYATAIVNDQFRTILSASYRASPNVVIHPHFKDL